MTYSPNACLAEELKSVGSPKKNGANRNCVRRPAIAKKATGKIKDESQIWVILLESLVSLKNSFSGLNNVRIVFLMKYYSLNLIIWIRHKYSRIFENNQINIRKIANTKE